MTGYGNNAYFTWPFSATESELGFNSPVDSTWPGQNVLITDWCWDEYSDWAWNSTGMELWAGPDNSTWSAAHRGFLGIALHTNHWGSSEALDDLTITVTPILNSTLNHGRSALLRTAEYFEYDEYWDEWGGNGTYQPGYPNISHNALEGIGAYAPTSSLVTDSTAITDDMVINGPHAEITATFGTLTIPGMPTVGVRQTAIDMLSGITYEDYGTVTADEAIPGWFSDNPANIENIVYVDGILAGQECRFTVEFGTWVGDPGVGGTLTHQGDFDIMVWAPGDTSFNYDYSLTGSSTASGANPEVGFFIAPATGTYTFGIDYYSGTLPIGWIFKFSAASVDTYIADGLTYTFDTHAIGTNAVFDVRARAVTGTSLDFFAEYSAISASNVTITNFFPPTVDITYPVGGEDLTWNVPFNITWTGTDPNVPEETLQYTVEVSNDTGATWKVVVFGTILNQASWDPTSSFYGFPPGDQFLVRVNCTDGRFIHSDTIGAVFTLTYVTPPPPPPWELITIAVVAIVVVVILLVTCFLKRKQTK
jgi:hypothetical protein